MGVIFQSKIVWGTIKIPFTITNENGKNGKTLAIKLINKQVIGTYLIMDSDDYKAHQCPFSLVLGWRDNNAIFLKNKNLPKYTAQLHVYGEFPKTSIKWKFPWRSVFHYSMGLYREIHFPGFSIRNVLNEVETTIYDLINTHFFEDCIYSQVMFPTYTEYYGTDFIKEKIFAKDDETDE